MATTAKSSTVVDTDVAVKAEEKVSTVGTDATQPTRLPLADDLQARLKIGQSMLHKYWNR